MEIKVRTVQNVDVNGAVPPAPPSSPGTRPASRPHTATPAAARATLADYWELTKPEISFLVTLSALAGFLLGSPETLDGWKLAYTLVGVAACAGGGGVLNHYLERDLDAEMRRTADRPLPTGRIAPHVALIFGIVLVAAGIATFYFVNALTMGLAALTVTLYLFVYTPLKRVTKYNTLIGTVPGALPALGGWTAATGSMSAGGWSLFVILALWQMPHFLSLAWMYRNDYARAGYRMLTVVEPDGRSTARQTLLFTAFLLGASTLPTVVGVAGWFYLVGALVLGGWFLLPAWAFFRSRTSRNARRVLFGSIIYVPILVALIFVDRLL